MGSCNNCGCIECSCSGQKPYYTDVCLQNNQNHCDETLICQYSPVVRVSNAWAVPAPNALITLSISALIDMVVGATIWSPVYGAYLIVSYDEQGQKIKVTKASYNNVAAGTVIPACTRFLITPALDYVPVTNEYKPFDIEPITLDLGTVGVVYNESEYAEVGETVNLKMAFSIEILTTPPNEIVVKLPFVASSGFFYQTSPIQGETSSTGLFYRFKILNGQNVARITKAVAGFPFALDTYTFTGNIFYKRQV